MATWRPTPKQRKALENALRDAFTRHDLDYMLQMRLDKKADEIATPPNYKLLVFEVINASMRQGWTADLLDAALAENPDNPALRRLAAELGLGAAPAPGQDLERIVDQDLGFHDFQAWSRGLYEIEGRVCRIELGNQPLGTGFLVADDVVMTNRHVVARVIADAGLRTSLGLRFDYKRLRSGVEVHPGTVFAVADDWLIDATAHSPHDTVPGSTELPGADRLDYALVRVAPRGGVSVGSSPVGGREIGGASERGWIPIPAVDPLPGVGQPLVIVQHPRGQPLTLAFDRVQSVNANRTRIRYTTNTEPGSSGSPCFNGRLELVALHHAGDPDYSELHHPGYNQGVPIAAIRALLAERGHGDVLPG